MEVGISIKGHRETFRGDLWRETFGGRPLERDLWRETFGERPLERDLWRDTLPGSDTRLLVFFRDV